MSENFYEELEARLTDSESPVRSAGKVKTGDDAAADGHAFLLGEYGSAQALDAAIKAGRPRVGSEKGEKSPVVRGAITAEDYAAMQTLIAETGMTQAQIVRRAVHELLHPQSAAA